MWRNEEPLKMGKSVDLPDLVWWRQFNDPELDALIKKALSNNKSPKIAMANIELANSQLNEIKLSWLPSASFLGGSFIGGFNQLPLLGNPGAFILATPVYVLNVLQLYKQQQSAQSHYRASIYHQETIRLQVIAQTASSYFTLLSQNELLAYYGGLINEYQKYLRLAKSQYRNGLVAQDKIDLLSSQIKLLEAKKSEIFLNTILTQNALHFLLNENPGHLSVNRQFRNIDSDGVIPTNLPASVLATRPDIREAEANLKAAHADIGATKATLLPAIGLGSLFLDTSNLGGLKLFQTLLFGPIIDLPLFAKISASKAQYKALYEKYILLVRDALKEVADDLSAYASKTVQLTKHQIALNDELKECQLVFSRYQNGLIDEVGPTRCRIKIIEFKILVNANKSNKMLSLVKLYQDLGGGYHEL